MDIVRKKIINRSFLREKQPILQSPATSRLKEHSKRHRPKPDITILESYIDEVCSALTSRSSLTQSIIERSPGMSEFLDKCLQELPDFSLQFYVLMSNILKRISNIQDSEDYSVLSDNLLGLSDFLKNQRSEGGLLEDIQRKGMEFDTRILSVRSM